MDEMEMISGFRRWLEDNWTRLLREGVQTDILGQTAYVPSSIHVNLKAQRHEAQVQLWEDGQSEFLYLDWQAADRNPDYQPEVVHYDFSDKEALLKALDELAHRLSPVLA